MPPEMEDAGDNGPVSGSGGGSGMAAGGAAGDSVTPPPDDPDAIDAGTGGEPSSVDDAGGVDAGEGTVVPSRPLVGPSYMGSVSNSADCSMSYPTQGHEPDTVGVRYPLFLYFVGTAFIASDAAAQYDSPAALAVTEAMARRGFVALSVQYDNDALAWLSDHSGQLSCLFGADNSASLTAAACALPNVDCELGIATWGHSQGGYVAAVAYDHEPRVRAAWTTGYGGDAEGRLPKDRLRVVNGEADGADNGTAKKLNTITGLTPDACAEPDQCLRADGSGWIIVRARELAMPETSTADHCWFDRPSCSSPIALEPNWVDPESDKPFALERNADWVARTVRR
jgi:hypothetical protein